MMIYTTSTTGSVTFSYFIPPPCQHAGLLLGCDGETQEVRFICPQCGRHIAVARAQIAADDTGDRLRDLLALAFHQPAFRTMTFPWQVVYPCRAVGHAAPVALARVSRIQAILRDSLGPIAAYLWRYSPLLEV